MSIIIGNQDSFNSLVEQSEVPVLVDFSAKWCGPCKMLEPVLEEIAKEYEGRAKVVKIDTDENQDLSIKYGITTIPSLKYFKAGEVKAEQGMASKSSISAEIDKLL